MVKKMSMQTIANRLGISKFSVSQALAGKNGVSQETRQRVLDMAETLGYRMKNIYPSHERQPSFEKSVLVSIKQEFRNEPDFWMRVLAGVITACTAYGWGYTIVEDVKDLPSPMSDDKIVGIIVLGTTSRNHLFTLRATGLPMILVDHDDPLIQADIILNANMDASRLACKHLLSKGCHSLIFVGRDSFSISFRERWWGCKMVTDDWRKSNPTSTLTLGKWTVPQIPSLWAQYFDKRLSSIQPDKMMDGFLCANDRIAIGLMESLCSHGIQVPGQCPVIGIDNVEASATSTPPLTTVFLAKEQLGTRAVEALKRRLTFSHAIPEKIILSAELIVRHSG
ncbi:MAG: LacI family DNA-binding transcriptional regulator [Gorillibacterium sp.]|nr:LacI family DNA-binding transcriptional regulator [Gorillibacterium sp.]